MNPAGLGRCDLVTRMDAAELRQCASCSISLVGSPVRIRYSKTDHA
jgi:hypothetical protein